MSAEQVKMSLPAQVTSDDFRKRAPRDAAMFDELASMFDQIACRFAQAETRPARLQFSRSTATALPESAIA